ncbi:mobilisation protein (MobC) [Anaerosporobacter mobilis DSM 15930]|uniref:Mobilisation protein (MobC) n=1 Tax=Anaerosporobacter mobilis DSM 15930 TaxID=1120996 RepID=A0A1M7HMB1_9FIRM|nr:mobilisation protein (MobC) [Anaerosporobacter mobilis DSM 15930]
MTGLADRIHCVRKTLRLMPVEAELLSNKAIAANMKEAEYLRLLISQKPNDYPEIRRLLKDLINEVNHIGNNINQIVRNNNSALYTKADKERLIAYMKKLNVVVNEAVIMIGNQ